MKEKEEQEREWKKNKKYEEDEMKEWRKKNHHGQHKEKSWEASEYGSLATANSLEQVVCKGTAEQFVRIWEKENGCLDSRQAQACVTMQREFSVLVIT